MEGKTVIIVSSPGVRDTIYCGIVEAIDHRFITLRSVVAILHYKKIGIAGCAGDPSGADSIRSGGPRRAWFYLRNIALVHEADPEAWADILEKGGR